MRLSGRKADELRHVEFMSNFIETSLGSCLAVFGNTKVICTVSVEEDVPRWLKEKNQGWLRAEYSMLPGSSRDRIPREAAKGRQSGRTEEIQRLIGRVLRSSVDLTILGARQIVVDCDAIQADGGTRCASICGASVALFLAFERLRIEGNLSENPMRNLVAAVSVGLVEGKALLDLDYSEDSQAQADMNVAMGEDGMFSEIQI